MRSFLVFVMWGFGLGVLAAEDWPTYQHDSRRSAVTAESLSFPLQEVWHYRSPVPPMTAWSGPAKWDAYSENDGLQSMRNFDPAFYVTAVDDAVYFGSSVDNATHCLDGKTGAERWVYFTNSAVRFPPTIAEDRAWFGSDDGHVYSVDALTGDLIWKYKPSADSRMIPSNGKLISPWPVRTGVLLKDGLAYFAASLLPWETSYLCAVDAATGVPHYVREESGVTLQGALLASSENLYAPQGRSVPLVYRLADGEAIGGIAGSGGVYCVLTEDEQFISMPASQKEKEDTVRIADGRRRETLVSFGGADRMIVSGPYAYSHQGNQLKAIDRLQIVALQAKIDELRAANEKRGEEEKKAQGNEDRLAQLKKEIEAANREIMKLEAQKPLCELWTREGAVPIGFMLAGTTLFVGGDGTVTAMNAATGEPWWSAEVEGKAYGLAAANGQLYVSTDRGLIYCYSAK